MTTNDFENSRVTEGTTNSGVQHVTNMSEESGAIEDLEVADRKATRRVLGATTLTGDRVRNAAGDDLGKVHEIMLDVARGRLAYAVLSFGGFLGIGDKLFAVPWSAMTFDQQAHEFVLDVPREVLESAPGFDKDNWPDMADPGYGSKIFSHYGKTPYWER
jgi:sporulation protein YlmC with PRC-barrel domain